MDQDFLAYLQGAGQNFNKYAAGTRRYGGGRDVPNVGPSDPIGYAVRDRMNNAKRNAMLRRLKAQQKRRYMSSDNLAPISDTRNM
jgi:hypothetical protein